MKAAGAQLQQAEELTGSNVGQLVQLLKLASLIGRPMHEGVAAPNDLSINELAIMMCLGGEGELAGHDISRLMAIPPMNVSRSLATLLGRGWIEQVSDPRNRRRKPVRLSATGEAAYAAMTPQTGEVADYLLNVLSPRERASLARMVARMIDRVEAWPARG